MFVEIAIQIITIISFSLGILLIPCLLYLIIIKKHKELGNFLPYWITLTLLIFGCIIDNTRGNSRVFSLTAFFSTFLITSLAYFVLRTTKRYKTLSFIPFPFLSFILLISTVCFRYSAPHIPIHFYTLFIITTVSLFLTANLVNYILRNQNPLFTKKIISCIVLSKLLYPVMITIDFLHIHSMSFNSKLILPVIYGVSAFVTTYDLVIIHFKAYKGTVESNYKDFYESYYISSREISIIEHLLQGLTYQEIGDRLYISINTVRFHIRNIYKKTNTNNKLELLNMVVIHTKK